MEGEVDRLGEEISELVPEPRVSPLHYRTVAQEVFEVLVHRDLLRRDVLQLDEDHLGVVGHDAGDEGGPDLGPLQGEIGPGEHDEGPGAGLHGHGDRVKHRGGGGEVSLVETQAVGGGSVLQVGGEALLHKVPVGLGVADEHVEELVLVGVDHVVLPPPQLGLAVEPLLDAAPEGEGHQVAHDDHDDGQEDGDQDGGVVDGRHLADCLVVRVGGLVSADDVIQRSHGLAQVVVSHAPQLLPVHHLVQHGRLVLHEVGDEVALAAPEVVGEGQVVDGRVGGQLPDGEGVQQVPVQPQHRQRLQAGECLLGNGWK